MTKPGIHRVTASSKSGRRMIHSGVDFYPHKVPSNIAAWNEVVELKKAAKRDAKAAKRERR